MDNIKNKVRIFGINIDVLSMSQSVQLISQWISAPERDCKFVVTPNIDHVVKLSSNQDFVKAYQHAALVVTDGKPLLMIAKLLGEKIQETVPGSDLVPAIFDAYKAANQELTVFLLGAAPHVAEQAKLLINQQWQPVVVVGTYSPDFGFEHNVQESNHICQLINTSKADLLVIGLGAPKQELWIHQYAHNISVKVALCVGATIDFIAGEKKRAPMLMRFFCIEWVYRMFSEPKRLMPRYFYDAWVFPRLFVKELYQRLFKA